MNMEEAELRVLSGMVQYSDRAFHVVEQLHIRADDFSKDEHRRAFDALIRHGRDTDVVALGKITNENIPSLKVIKKWEDFLALVPSIGEVDHHICAFAEGVARGKAWKEISDVFSNGNLPAQMLPQQLDSIRDDMSDRLEEINRFHGGGAGDNDKSDDAESTPEELLNVPGFVNALAEYTYSTMARYNRVTAFAGALAMMSYLAARKFTDKRNTMPNLYLVALAGSGAGKDAPRKSNKALARLLKRYNTVADSFSSGQGIEDALLVNPALLFQMDEFDTLFNELKDKSALSEGKMKCILNLFSESNSYHAMRKKALTDRERQELTSGNRRCAVSGGVIHKPSLTLFGTAVPAQFYKSLSLRALTNGLLARCLVFETDHRGERNESQELNRPIPDSVLQMAKELADREDQDGWYDDPKITVVPDGDGVAEALKAIQKEEDRLYKICERAKDEAGVAVWNRCVELAGKLALLYAVSENPSFPKISVNGVQWAWKLVKHSAERMLIMADKYVTDDKDDADANVVLEKIRNEKGGITRDNLSHLVRYGKKRLDAALDTLIDRNDIKLYTGYHGLRTYFAKSKKGGKR